jgi:hypothetical protein
MPVRKRLERLVGSDINVLKGSGAVGWSARCW